MIHRDLPTPQQLTAALEELAPAHPEVLTPAATRQLVDAAAQQAAARAHAGRLRAEALQAERAAGTADRHLTSLLQASTAGVDEPRVWALRAAYGDFDADHRLDEYLGSLHESFDGHQVDFTGEGERLTIVVDKYAVTEAAPSELLVAAHAAAVALAPAGDAAAQVCLSYGRAAYDDWTHAAVTLTFPDRASTAGATGALTGELLTSRERKVLDKQGPAEEMLTAFEAALAAM